MISRLKWIKARGDGTTITDLGAGYNVFMAHLSQRLPQITVVGIENCVPQAHGYAAGMRNLLSSSVILENNKFSYLIADLWQLQDLNWTNIVYMYDEAFPTELILHLYQLFIASDTAQYLITFKAGKKSKGNSYLLKGFLNDDEVECVGTVRAHKRGSYEGSTAKFYQKIGKGKPRKYRKRAKHMDFQDAVMYNASHMISIINKFGEDVKDEHEKLVETTSEILSRKRAAKKSRNAK